LAYLRRSSKAARSTPKLTEMSTGGRFPKAGYEEIGEASRLTVDYSVQEVPASYQGLHKTTVQV
jgi:hypothetical protein